MGIGKRLKALLAEKKNSQDSLALQLDLSQAAVSKWCREKSEPDIDTLKKIAVILNTDLNDYIAARRRRGRANKTIHEELTILKAAITRACPRDQIEQLLKDWPVRQLQKACKALNVQYKRFHGCRHTFATKAANSGVGLPKVQAQLGHTNLATTQKYIRQNQMDDNEIRLVDFG